VNSPQEALDIRGNMHFNRVSNVSSVSVDSNVVAEYTGPHDRPLRKYPEVELDVNAMTSPGVGGYIVAQSGQYTAAFAGWGAFGEEFTTALTGESSLVHGLIVARVHMRKRLLLHITVLWVAYLQLFRTRVL
jgi:hypothetical protein